MWFPAHLCVPKSGAFGLELEFALPLTQVWGRALISSMNYVVITWNKLLNALRS